MDPIHDYAQFAPLAYLREYYATVSAENVALLRFLVGAIRQTPPGARTLDFGNGPTLYAALAACARAGEIHLADYSPANVGATRAWLRGDADAFDWSAFTRAILQDEGVASDEAAIAARHALARQRIQRVMACDAYAPYPLAEPGQSYDLVMTNFCAEAAATDAATWRTCMTHVLALLRPGGRAIVSAVMGADSYAVGSTAFLAVRLYPADLRAMLVAEGVQPATIELSSVPADGPERHYAGLMFATGLKAGRGLP